MFCTNSCVYEYSAGLYLEESVQTGKNQMMFRNNSSKFAHDAHNTCKNSVVLFFSTYFFSMYFF